MLTLVWCALLVRSASSRALEAEDILELLGQFLEISHHSAPEEAAKLVEDYVVAADFDNRSVAQIHLDDNHQQSDVNESNLSAPLSDPTETEKVEALEPATRIVDYAGSKVSSDMTEAFLMPPLPPDHLSSSLAGFGGVYQHSAYTAADRDALIPHGPAPLLISQRSVLAVGFITFLILLSSLQSSVVNMMSANRPAPPAGNSLLGGVTQALGRRRKR